MKRRLNIGVALLHHPEILIMDEPTVGVDVESRACILEAIKQFSTDGVTVIYTSHFSDEMESICDRIAVLKEGTIEAVGSAEQINKYTSR